MAIDEPDFSVINENLKGSAEHVTTLSAELAGLRVDQAVSQTFPDFSRSRLQQWIKTGDLLVDGRKVRPRDKVAGGEKITLTATFEPEAAFVPQNIPLNVVYQDDDLLVVNKPAGLVVHPAAGNPDGTLLNGLLHLDSELAELPRAGLVHRLDKDTSGLLVVARSQRAYQSLIEQLQQRAFEREYRAIVNGLLVAGGTVNEPIGRHPTHRIRMAVHPNGKEAVTHFRLLQRFRAHSYLKVNLETGRTHQIRVHMAFIRHPITGDPLYGGRPRLPPHPSTELVDTVRGFTRQALHARKLGFVHPVSAKPMCWTAPLPDDMQQLLSVLGDDANLDEADFYDDFE